MVPADMTGPASTPINITYLRIASIAGPVIINQLTITLMGVIDVIMVGQLGVQALAAVGFAAMVSITVFAFFSGMFNAVNTLVAQAVGAGDRRAAGVALWQGLYLAVLTALVMGAVWWVVPTLFRWAGATPGVQALGIDYMRIRLLGGFGFAVIAAASNFYRGIGRTQVLMYSALVQLVLNCGLNYVLIFGKFGAPALGTSGAAIGTITAQWVVGLALFGTLWGIPAMRNQYELARTWRWRQHIFTTLLRLSLPIGGQLFLEVASLAVFTAAIGRLGEAQLAASNVAWQAWSIGFMVGVGLSVSATTLVGQCIGAGTPDEARQVVRRVLYLAYGAMAAVVLIYLLAPEQIMAAFVDTGEFERLRPYARPLFLMVALVVGFDMQMSVMIGALRGAGDVTYPAIVSLLCPWLIFVPATLFVAPRFGVTAAWGALVINYVIMAALMTWRVRGSAWLKPAQRR